MEDLSAIVTTPLSINRKETLTNDESLMDQALEFESIFVGQMLKFSGFSDAITQNSGFGGEAFSAMLLQEYAHKIVESGGFGLAEQIYKQLVEDRGSNENLSSA